jgi:dihydroorotase-like cyclic amidohydrolase
MLKIKNVKTLEGKTADIVLESPQDFQLDAQGTLTQLPALIDPLASFRIEGAAATLAAGITTLFLAPDASAPSSTYAEFQQKRDQIVQQLAKNQLPLQIQLYLGNEWSDTAEIGKAKKEIVAIWIEAADLNGERQQNLDRVFQVAAQDALLLAVLLKNEGESQKRLRSLETLLKLAEKYKGEIALMDVSSREELNLLQEYKQKELMAYSATTLSRLYGPHYGPHSEWLWEAIQEGTIDMLGSGSIPAPLVLPLLLNSCNERKMSLEKLVALTRIHVEEIFHLKQNSDRVLVNLEKKQTVREGPFAGMTLTGWPLYTIASNQVYRC